jgi:hypothetical protein
MKVTVIGTVWACEPGEVKPSKDSSDKDSDEEPVGYTVKVVEHLPGWRKKGQAVYLELTSDTPLRVGSVYRITAQVFSIVPTQADDDQAIDGAALEAEPVEVTDWEP